MPDRSAYDSVAAYNKAFAEEFRANHGQVSGPMAGRTCLILTTTGARTGRAHETPLVYTTDDGRYIVSAAAGGAPNNPAWYHNLVKNPRATVELGDRTIEVDAHEAVGDERERLHERRLEESPTYKENVAKTARRIPLMVLTPVGS
jgi:deazaflavin-dependent oxidoreductase (nitroreductase family)